MYNVVIAILFLVNLVHYNITQRDGLVNWYFIDQETEAIKSAALIEGIIMIYYSIDIEVKLGLSHILDLYL